MRENTMLLDAKTKVQNAVWSGPSLFALAKRARREISLFQLAHVAGHAGLKHHFVCAV